MFPNKVVAITVQSTEDEDYTMNNAINNDALHESTTTYETKFIITEHQIALVNEELKKIDEDPKYLLDWEDVKNELNIA